MKINFSGKIDELKLYTAFGQEIKTVLLSGDQLDISSFENGVYFLEIQSQGRKYCNRLLRY